jgi:hypothetical protein
VPADHDERGGEEVGGEAQDLEGELGEQRAGAPAEVAGRPAAVLKKATGSLAE